MITTLSQYLNNLGVSHWEGVKRILRYVRGTTSIKLTYGTEQHNLIGYTDADRLHNLIAMRSQAMHSYLMVGQLAGVPKSRALSQHQPQKQSMLWQHMQQRKPFGCKKSQLSYFLLTMN